MFSVIESHSPSSHGHAEDTQLYSSINPYRVSNQVVAVQDMENCISNVRDWMTASKLKMNDDKTECMLIETRQQLAKVSLEKIKVGENSIPPSQIVKNLGTLMDCNLTFHKQVNNCKTPFYFLYGIRKIRKYLTKDVTATLFNALVISRVDYCNSILYGLPAYQIAKLQRVQNTAARLVYMIPKFTHISPYLKELHWLPVKFRIAILTFQAIHGLAPKYLCELVRIKEQSTYHLRSSEEIILLQPPEKSVTRLMDRAFQFAAPRLWNRLPKDLRLLNSISTFKKQLKTYLFRMAYDIT